VEVEIGHRSARDLAAVDQIETGAIEFEVLAAAEEDPPIGSEDDGTEIFVVPGDRCEGPAQSGPRDVTG